ncbi:MAG: CopG family transcriptional regulator [candidate division Zixibacteria bacterium CG_4_9_14_3_um_filter_46_8]|nr:MAG: CopG family transcriptional regulator [candidate division Zixibacteria bacterium CG_4_9_14_3_um_filter_46_8]
MSDPKVTIKIPRPLYIRLKQIIEETGFDSVTDFIVYILRDIAATADNPTDIHLTKEEITLIKTRLKSLGYL